MPLHVARSAEPFHLIRILIALVVGIGLAGLPAIIALIRSLQSAAFDSLIDQAVRANLLDIRSGPAL